MRDFDNKLDWREIGHMFWTIFRISSQTFKNFFLLKILWQLECGVIGTFKESDFYSAGCLYLYSFYQNFFIPYSTKLNNWISLEPNLKEVECQGTLVPYNGGCSIMVVRSVVGSDVREGQSLSINSEQAREFRETRVRFSPSALFNIVRSRKWNLKQKD